VNVILLKTAPASAWPRMEHGLYRGERGDSLRGSVRDVG
jgi:hypothetical protein